MKNIHLIATDKPSRLFKDDNQVLNLHTHSVLKGIFTNGIGSNQHIYITNDEEIKIDDWYLDDTNSVRQAITECESYWTHRKKYQKIILTTDIDLIKDGVQAIDDEFLEWFVKNPSCERVEIKTIIVPFIGIGYKIIIPKEEPKQETLEEASKKYVDNHKDVSQFLETYIVKSAFHDGAKWQQKRMYSEEDMINLLMIFGKWYNNNEIIKPRSFILTDDILVFINEQFKKK